MRRHLWTRLQLQTKMQLIHAVDGGRTPNHHGHNSGSILYELARTEVQSLFLQARMSATKCMFLSSSLLFMERGTFRGTDRHTQRRGNGALRTAHPCIVWHLSFSLIFPPMSALSGRLLAVRQEALIGRGPWFELMKAVLHSDSCLAKSVISLGSKWSRLVNKRWSVQKLGTFNTFSYNKYKCLA